MEIARTYFSVLICFRHYFKSVRPIRKKFSCLYLTKLCRDETSVRIVDPQTKVRLHCFPRVWQFEGHSKNHMYVYNIYIYVYYVYIYPELPTSMFNLPLKQMLS